MFKKGKKLVCKNHSWTNGNNIKNFKAPKIHEIVTVRDVKVRGGYLEYSFMEYSPKVYYPVKYFRALDYAFVDRIIKKVSSSWTF